MLWLEAWVHDSGSPLPQSLLLSLLTQQHTALANEAFLKIPLVSGHKESTGMSRVTLLWTLDTSFLPLLSLHSSQAVSPAILKTSPALSGTEGCISPRSWKNRQ